MPWRAKNAEAHRAADQDRVGGLEEAVDHAILSATLAPPSTTHERTRGVVAHRGQLADLALEQQARVAGQLLGDPSVVAWARWAAPKASLT